MCSCCACQDFLSCSTVHAPADCLFVCVCVCVSFFGRLYDLVRGLHSRFGLCLINSPLISKKFTYSAKVHYMTPLQKNPKPLFLKTSAQGTRMFEEWAPTSPLYVMFGQTCLLIS